MDLGATPQTTPPKFDGIKTTLPKIMLQQILTQKNLSLGNKITQRWSNEIFVASAEDVQHGLTAGKAYKLAWCNEDYTNDKTGKSYKAGQWMVLPIN